MACSKIYLFKKEISKEIIENSFHTEKIFNREDSFFKLTYIEEL